ncbi:hypothetical protein TSUD_161680 [Trifolium subterraneum]|uniref:Uncharacterized protein n=1 Tax=Trifolium subterraneum TaxID=3900 RepID=A0A2Z6MIW0_TRISU|nr:hypothetical protein TSUD_161680 [Trifolium subterraneum]
MEDGVTEVHSLFPPRNHNSEERSKRKYNEENEEGFVNSTGKAEKVKESGLDIDEAKNSSSGGGGGGVISNFISNLMTPLSPRTGKVTTEDESGNGVVEKEEEIGNNGGEKGVISNLVSNFFHRNECEEGVVETEKDKENDEEIKADEKIKRLKTDENEANGDSSGGGGLIHDIVSHLPTSIPDDAAPTADEATFLINSLVRD